jgi:hypothetical protein
MTQTNLENVINANANFAAIDNIDAKSLAFAGIQADYADALKKDREARRQARRDARREQWDNIPTGGKVAIYIVGGVAVACLIVGGVIIAKRILDANEAACCGCAEQGDASLLCNLM